MFYYYSGRYTSALHTSHTNIMDAQIKNIVSYLESLGGHKSTDNIKSIIKNIPINRHVQAAVRGGADRNELISLYGRLLLTRLEYAGLDKIYSASAQLGMMMEGAWADEYYLFSNPGAEDMGYTRSNTTFSQQCGHHSADPIICSVCGASTERFSGVTWGEVENAQDY